MKLTVENKKKIDNLNLEELLRGWRFHALGDSFIQGETGDYWAKRLFALRDEDNSEWVRTSKKIGW